MFKREPFCIHKQFWNIIKCSFFGLIEIRWSWKINFQIRYGKMLFLRSPNFIFWTWCVLDSVSPKNNFSVRIHEKKNEVSLWESHNVPDNGSTSATRVKTNRKWASNWDHRTEQFFLGIQSALMSLTCKSMENWENILSDFEEHQLLSIFGISRAQKNSSDYLLSAYTITMLY